MQVCRKCVSAGGADPQEGREEQIRGKCRSTGGAGGADPQEVHTHRMYRSSGDAYMLKLHFRRECRSQEVQIRRRCRSAVGALLHVVYPHDMHSRRDCKSTEGADIHMGRI